MIRVSHHLFRFHYQSQKVMGSLGISVSKIQQAGLLDECLPEKTKQTNHHQQTRENKPQQISRLKMYTAIRPSRPQKGTTYMTPITTQREKLTSPLKKKKKNDGWCLSTPSPSPFEMVPLPLGPFHVKGIKGCTRWLKVVPFTLQTWVISPHFITIGDRGPPCTFFDKPWNFSGTWTRGSSNVKVWCHNSQKKQHPNLYIYIYITYPIDIKNDGHLKVSPFKYGCLCYLESLC